MTGPEDEKAAVAADRGLLRASHADREQAIDALKAAFVLGRLTKDEFDARMGQAFASRTYAELAAVTDDIPAGPIGAQSPANTRLKAGVCAITAATVLLAGAWVGAWLAHVGNPEIIVLLISLTVVFSGAWLVTGSVALLESRQQNRSGRQLPPQSTPRAGGRASQRPASAASAEQLPPSGRGQQHTAEAAPRRRLRPPLSAWRWFTRPAGQPDYGWCRT
jgi:Domain of unknown function (DUF1707)